MASGKRSFLKKTPPKTHESTSLAQGMLSPGSGRILCQLLEKGAMIAMLSALSLPHPSTTFEINDFEVLVRGARHSESKKTTAQGSAMSELIEFELVRSGYPMHNVRCHCTESLVHLTGHVRRYYYLQTAIEIARRLANGRRIVNEIEVLQRPDEDFDANDGEF